MRPHSHDVGDSMVPVEAQELDSSQNHETTGARPMEAIDQEIHAEFSLGIPIGALSTFVAISAVHSIAFLAKMLSTNFFGLNLPKAYATWSLPSRLTMTV